MLTANSRVGQLKQALRKHLIDKKYNFQWILNKVEDVNSKVTATNYLEKYYPEWIGSTILHFAADSRDLESFNVLLDHGADYTIKNRDGLTALHLIIKKCPNLLLQGYIIDDPFVESVLSAHLKYNKFQNAMDNSGLSHFHLACAANNIELVKGFLDNGVSIDHTVEMDSLLFPGYSSLHFATKFFAFEVVDLLLYHGANVHKKDAKNMTALHIALERKTEIIKDTHSIETLKDANEKIFILLLGKDMNNSMSTGDNNWGLSHLHVSCALKDSKAAENLLKKNPDININSIVSTDSPLWPGYTPLHFAALGNIDTVKLLIKRGADMNIKNAKGVTAFEICIERYKPQDIHSILSLNPVWEKITLSDGKTKLTELVFAMRDSNDFEVFLKKLSKSSSICDSPLWPGCSPMHLAIIFAKTIDESGDESVEMNLEILKTLYKQFPSMIHNQDVHGRTPLHLAFQFNKKLVLELLMKFLQECPNLVDCVDKDGLSYMHIASALNNVNLIDQLLTMGVNVNAAYEGKTAPHISPGSTALHFAVVNNSTGAVGTLLKHGADINMKDAYDMTPIHLLLSGYDTISVPSKSTKEMGDMLLLSPNLQESIVIGVGLSHLHVASWLGKTKAIEHLLNNGSNINCVVTYESISSEEWSELKFIQSIAGYSPLLIASVDFNFTKNRLLVKRGADCLIVDSYDGKPWLYGFVDIEENELGWQCLIECLREREDLQARVRADTGMTALHMACLCRNIEDVGKALREGANVNDQININSPILQGYTPLHILIRTWTAVRDKNDEILQVLLKAGPDVTLQSAASSKTAVHLAHDLFEEDNDDEYSSLVKMLLETQDTSINPTCVDGFSHLYIACKFCSLLVVQKLLSNTNIDVDQRLSNFYMQFYVVADVDGKLGHSALHLVAGRSCVPDYEKLQKLDLLMKHGANVHAEDQFGETPLHDCARWSSHYGIQFFRTLVRGGSDVNARNIYGSTPFDVYLASNNIFTVERMILLLSLGCRLNAFNTVDGSGTVAQTANVLSHEDMKKLLIDLGINFPQEMETDNVGRSILQNLVSSKENETTADQYFELVEKICTYPSCDVDHQDNLGRTALHMAAEFFNFKAISALLLAGANVNVIDFQGKAPFSSDFMLERNYQENGEVFTWAVHLKKLKLCRLDVKRENEDFLQAFERLNGEVVPSHAFYEESENLKDLKIEPYVLTLFDFLSETGAVANYPRMPLTKREDVIKFFSSKEKFLQKEFPEMAGIIALQWRKAKARPQIVKSAEIALLVITESVLLPEICSIILTFLSNADLKSLIASL